MPGTNDLHFLKRFPHLTDWLNLNGYSMIYSHSDEYDQIHTMWSDRTNEPVEDGHTDARNWVTIVYCKHCNVVDVYKRIAVGAQGDDEQLVKELDGQQGDLSDGSAIDIVSDENDQLLL